MEVKLKEGGKCGIHDTNSGFFIPDLQVCCSVPGEAATCRGDTGGPIVYKSDGRPICLIGISSFNMQQCNHPNYPSIFILASVLKIWIRNKIDFFGN